MTTRAEQHQRQRAGHAGKDDGAGGKALDHVRVVGADVLLQHALFIFTLVCFERAVPKPFDDQGGNT